MSEESWWWPFSDDGTDETVLIGTFTATSTWEAMFYGILGGAIILLIVGVCIYVGCPACRGPPGFPIMPPIYPPAPNGDPGGCGTNGIDGTQIYTGEGDPNTKPECRRVNVGDLYLDTFTQEWYQFINGSWLLQLGPPLGEIIEGNHTVTGTWTFAGQLILGALTVQAGTNTDILALPSSPPLIKLVAASTALMLSGIVPGVPGQLLWIVVELGGGLFTIVDNSTEVDSRYSIDTLSGANLVFSTSTPGVSIQLIYVDTLNWQLVSVM